MLPYKCWLIGDETIFFSKPPILNIFSPKFQGLVLGQVQYIDANGINVAQPIWLSGCPMQCKLKKGLIVLSRPFWIFPPHFFCFIPMKISLNLQGTKTTPAQRYAIQCPQHTVWNVQTDHTYFDWKFYFSNTWSLWIGNRNIGRFCLPNCQTKYKKQCNVHFGF